MIQFEKLFVDIVSFASGLLKAYLGIFCAISGANRDAPAVTHTYGTEEGGRRPEGHSGAPRSF